MLSCCTAGSRQDQHLPGRPSPPEGIRRNFNADATISPVQWPRGARSPFQHKLLGRRCRATERTFRVVNVSTILGLAMVVSAPADIDDHTDPEMDTFYLSDSEYHMQGARYHGGPSDEGYLKFIDIHRVDTNMPAADAEDSAW